MPTATQKAPLNKDGEPVCAVCGSRTHDPNIAYCSPSHAEAAGSEQLVSTSIVGANNSDNLPSGEFSDDSQFLGDRKAEVMVEHFAEENAEAKAKEAYVAVEPETGEVTSPNVPVTKVTKAEAKGPDPRDHGDTDSGGTVETSDLSELSVADLRKLASEADIEGRSSMGKEELVKALS